MAAPTEPWKAFEARQRSPELKREAVLKTAAQLFLEQGYGRTSMVQIAIRLRVTKPALYYYFRNKEEILVECYRSGIAGIEAHIAQVNVEGGTGLTRLQGYVQAYLTAILTHEFGRCVAHVDDAELSEEGRHEVRALKRRVDLFLRELVNVGVADGSIGHANPKLVSFAISGAINWTGTWYRPDGELSPQLIAEEYTKILTCGLARQNG